jgi:hypothetical protein
MTLRSPFLCDDGPGKTVRSSDRLSLDVAAGVLRWGPADGRRPAMAYAVRPWAPGDTIRFVAETDGTDDDRPATLRETIAAWSDGIEIRRDVRFTDTSIWAMRHVYAFSRRRP